MKKITFPRVEVFLQFGQVLTLYGMAAIPMQLSVHNFSKYQPEKNVQAQIICDRGAILPTDKAPKIIQDGADVLGKRVEILHHKVAHVEHFALLVSEQFQGEKRINITVFLSGDLAPVITSSYELIATLSDTLKCSVYP